MASNPCSVCITASKFNTPIFTPTDSRILKQKSSSIARSNQQHQSYPDTDRTKAIIDQPSTSIILAAS
ncbi:MAG: hypothetical protein JGK17_19605 [Microcoleus sp. PH2017_10_PVI_O_A]|uniref:hypothetical protein n=1 Tax=unclassified Microcoleus TaxID=2642155 RepID=UPI001DCA24B4|nr:MULTISPECIES: hypothetical protein [unclassified Microcoleus]MCC3407755.1 hypothetical protein [Microcoleus sp. PH2017_10_PVI_O_A]MCC3461943.1 hypothetical protein [Microcoleus sp. PH2017_11_PCY_U_A]MCC3561224.1 hypothetical protein [Microcoleus sp. PH2017_27_LUM_O_A]